MFDLPAVQSALREFGFDAWLLADFRGSNVLARRILKIADEVHTSRRFFYCVPVEGQADILISGVPYISPYNVNSFLNPLLVQVMANGYLFNLYKGSPMVKRVPSM